MSAMEGSVTPLPVRHKAVPDGVLGTMVFILTEVMFFGGFISAFNIAGSNSMAWPPADQPRLPIESTAFNTAILLASAALVFFAARRFKGGPARARHPLLAGLALGATFVALQGAEWVALIGEGLVLSTSPHAGFFYLIVGTHAVHVCAGLVALGVLTARLWRGTLSADAFWAGRIWWYFVCLLWPILYWRVYL